MNITSSSAEINWTIGNNSINTEIEYGLLGFSVGSGTVININSSNNSYELVNLNPETIYDFYLKKQL